MNLHTLFLTKNACYQAGKKMTVKGLMIHSTAANNPNLKRYVGPDDGKLGVNKYGNHWNVYHPEGKDIGPHTYSKKNGRCAVCGGRQVCCHGFIGLLKDGSVGTYQTLPWDMVAWHSGGTANNSYIGVEICEDDTNSLDYLKKVYKEAVELFAYLCKEYKLDPMKDGVVICHSEGAKRGIASNHSDVIHWWKKHGITMDDFRRDIAAELETEEKKNDGSLKVGDEVIFTGNTHYVGSGASKGKPCKPGPAKITVTAPGKAHPYHVVGISGGGSTVYGWVDVADIAIKKDVEPYFVKTTELLNIRKGPGTNFEIAGHLLKGLLRVIEAEATSSTGKWGKLKGHSGWISLDYVSKM